MASVSARDEERVVDRRDRVLEGQQALAAGLVGERDELGDQLGGRCGALPVNARIAPRHRELGVVHGAAGQRDHQGRAEHQQQGRQEQQAHRVAALHHVRDDDDDERDEDPDQGCRIHQDSVSVRSASRPRWAVGCSETDAQAWRGASARARGSRSMAVLRRAPRRGGGERRR